MRGQVRQDESLFTTIGSSLVDSRHLTSRAREHTFLRPRVTVRRAPPSQTDLSRGAEIIARFCSCHEVRGGRKCLESIQLDLRMILLVSGENFLHRSLSTGVGLCCFRKLFPYNSGPRNGKSRNTVRESTRRRNLPRARSQPTNRTADK